MLLASIINFALRKKSICSRNLNAREEELARAVFHDELPYGRIHLTNNYFPGGTGAMTLATSVAPPRAEYFIFWDRAIFEQGTDNLHSGYQATFIHELTHVWQGHHGTSSATYMARSLVAQGVWGARDIWRQGEWLGWNTHRSTAYEYADAPGLEWERYNVEQQASIIEDWFNPNKSNCSPNDWRYFYVERVIRCGNPRERGRPNFTAASSEVGL